MPVAPVNAWGNFSQDELHVVLHAGVGVFLDRDATRRMCDEEEDRAACDAARMHDFLYLPCNIHHVHLALRRHADAFECHVFLLSLDCVPGWLLSISR